MGSRYSLFFTCVLYLTIGPLFAIPRCATVPFETGVAPALGGSGSQGGAGGLFAGVFCGGAGLFPSARGKILTWVGKVLNPLFLVCLGVLLAAALIHPMGPVSAAQAQGAYAQSAFVGGFLEGYNTMDALAGLAFGIVVVNVIRDLGVTEPGAIAVNTVAAGCLGCGLMGVIYLAVAVVGAQSRGVYPAASNGRRGPAHHCPALFRRIRGRDPGGDRHLCLPENGGGADHQLFPDLLPAVPPWPRLPYMGGSGSAFSPLVRPISAWRPSLHGPHRS